MSGSISRKRDNIKLLEDNDFFNFKISVKSSDVFLTVKSICNFLKFAIILTLRRYRGRRSINWKHKVINRNRSVINSGIGDTIRVSLSSDPLDEIKAGYEILKSLGIRSRGVNIISCPSCARQAFPVIDTVKRLEEKLSHIKTPITLSIIGCVVNGPEKPPKPR